MEFKYFKLSDFDCQETGENKMEDDFILWLDACREACGFPFIITSGFRSKNHSVERIKTSVGTHVLGIACDIKVNNGSEKMTIVKEAIRLGFTGIGIAKNFIHLDRRTTTPVIWTY